MNRSYHPIGKEVELIDGSKVVFERYGVINGIPVGFMANGDHVPMNQIAGFNPEDFIIQLTPKQMLIGIELLRAKGHNVDHAYCIFTQRLWTRNELIELVEGAVPEPFLKVIEDLPLD